MFQNINNVFVEDKVHKYEIYSDYLKYLEKTIFTEGNSRAITLISKNEVSAEKFEYNIDKEVIVAENNVFVEDKVRKYEIYSDYLKYLRKKETIFTEGNSRAINLISKNEVSAEKFEYNIYKEILNISKNVILINNLENIKIFSEFISYNQKEDKIFSSGSTEALIDEKYKFFSEDVLLLNKTMQLSSKKNTKIEDNINLYKLDKFQYSINKNELKGENILINSNFQLPNSDKFYFSNAIINLNSQDFLAKDTKINIHKNVFNNPENDPRLYGSSSSKKNNKIIVKKGIFTNCKKRDGCPPWSIQADQILHDKDKKQLSYDNALLKIYDFPVFIFQNSFIQIQQFSDKVVF